jgi:hypothetical protein
MIPGGMSDLTIPEQDPDLFNLPELPYAGTSGWSGSGTSRKRAKQDDTNGRTKDRQVKTLESLDQAGDLGLTYKELGEIHGWHHGQSSGALSVLHKTGRIARLAESRNRCKVYVTPGNIDNRLTEPHSGNMTARTGKQPEAYMLTERQADLLIDGQRILVDRVARTLETDEMADRHEQAERIIGTIADWLTDYRPYDLGSEYISPLDVTAFILRKGQPKER